MQNANDMEVHQQHAIEWLSRIAQEGEEHVREQAPLLVGEILNWGIFTHIFVSIVFLLVACVFVYLADRIIKLSGRRPADELFVLSVLCIGIALISVVIVVLNVFWLVQIFLAPRLYLIDWLSDLVVSTTG